MNTSGQFATLRKWIVGLGLALPLGLSGCGSRETAITMDTDGKGVSDVIEALNDAKLSTKQAEPLFVKGALPATAEFKKLGAYSYALIGKPSVSGTSATIPVSMTKEVDGSDAGKKDWTFEKVGTDWKIKTVTLP